MKKEKDMSNFKKIIEEILKEIESLAEGTFKEHKDKAFKDGKSFLDKIEDDLERFSNLLAKGELKAEEFKWLVRSKKDLAEMALLKQAGLAVVKIDKFKDSLLDLIIGRFLKITGL
jgi:hypothetical protein